MLKRGTNLNIYDDSEESSSTGQVYMSIPFADVTSPATANINALYTEVLSYVDVSSGGGVGISNPSFCTLNVPDGTQTSANTWYVTKQMCPFDMTLAEFEIYFSFAGVDTVTVAVWSEDRTTLIDSTSATTTISETTLTPLTGATLIGGTSYWVGAKCLAGVSDFFKNTGFADAKVCISFFNAGTPATIPATAGTVAPKICLKG